VRGTIDGKFDDGYIVTVDLGSEQLKGVLYHVSSNASKGSSIGGTFISNIQKKSRLSLCDYMDRNQIGVVKISFLLRIMPG